MFKRSTSGAGLLVGTAILAVYATPAHAATIKWRVGPLELAAGQAAEVGMSNTNIFPCTIGVQISAGLVEKRGDAFVLTSVVHCGRHIFGPRACAGRARAGRGHQRFQRNPRTSQAGAGPGAGFLPGRHGRPGTQAPGRDDHRRSRQRSCGGHPTRRGAVEHPERRRLRSPDVCRRSAASILPRVGCRSITGDSSWPMSTLRRIYQKPASSSVTAG